jgi:hypothetical protein
MMPRTKHIVVLVALLIVLLVGVLLYVSFQKGNPVFSYYPSSEALVINADLPEAELGVVVLQSTTREETRKGIVAALGSYTEPEEKIISAPEEEKRPEEESVITLPACEPVVPTTVGAQSWGSVNVTLEDAGRVLRSLEVDAHGNPTHTLLLTASPLVNTAPTCVVEGMIGLSLDGRVIEAGVPFTVETDGLAGYARDGFGIFGMYEDGETVSSSALDQCHGHIHPIIWNGVSTMMYHYHTTADAPYTLGCYRGTPAPY